MSDIEILEVVHSNSKKKKRKNDGVSSKRKRTSSGLIEKSETLKGTETVLEEFVIDRTITPQRKLTVKDVEKGEEGETGSEWRKRLESTLLGCESTPEVVKNPRNNRYQKACFNCDGEHNLRDCTKPKNFARIRSKQRQSADEYSRKQMSDRGLSKHRDKNLKPGELSDRLRFALGLEKNDIPDHIYRMRKLGFIKGYPPGWLKKAIKSTDVLKFFTSEENPNEEEKLKPPELDASKIVWFPGFNEEDVSLNDEEKFKIPPKNMFCEYYQDELTELFVKQQKLEKKRSDATPRHKKFIDEDDDDDVVIIDQTISQNSDKFVTPGEELVTVTLSGHANPSESSRTKTSDEKEVKKGESMFEIVGTPVFGSHHKIMVAPLEAFAVGIQPFDMRDVETTNKGNFKKLMEKLKQIRGEDQEIEILEEPSVIEIPQNTHFTDEKVKRKKNRKKKKQVNS